jgi:hypothetical protein
MKNAFWLPNSPFKDAGCILAIPAFKGNGIVASSHPEINSKLLQITIVKQQTHDNEKNHDKLPAIICAFAVPGAGPGYFYRTFH